MDQEFKLEFKNNNDFILLFEKRLREFTGAPYVVLTDSCTNALFLSLLFYKYKITSPVSIPNQTYVSLPMLIEQAKLKFEYQDINWFKSYELGNTNIWDYAVGFEKDMYIPGQVQCLSFQQKKVLNIGRGGAILLDNENDYYLLKRMTHNGRDSSISVSNDHNIIFGFSMYMTPDDAAKGVLLLNQLSNKKLDEYLLDYSYYPNLDLYYKGLL